MCIVAVQVLEHCAGRRHRYDVSQCVCNGFRLKLTSSLTSLVHVAVCVIISFLKLTSSLTSLVHVAVCVIISFLKLTSSLTSLVHVAVCVIISFLKLTSVSLIHAVALYAWNYFCLKFTSVCVEWFQFEIELTVWKGSETL